MSLIEYIFGILLLNLNYFQLTFQSNFLKNIRRLTELGLIIFFLKCQIEILKIRVKNHFFNDGHND